MWPDWASNPGPMTYESGALATDCATQPGLTDIDDNSKIIFLFSQRKGLYLFT